MLGEAAALVFGKGGLFLPALPGVLYIFLRQIQRRQGLYFQRISVQEGRKIRCGKEEKAALVLFCIFALLGSVSFLAQQEADQVEGLLMQSERAGRTFLAGRLEGRVEAIRITSSGRILIMGKGAEFHFGNRSFYCSFRCRAAGAGEEEGDEPDARMTLCPGDRVILTGKLTSFAQEENPGEFPARDYYYANGIRYAMAAEKVQLMERPWFSVSRAAFLAGRRLAGIYDVCVAERERGLFKAMVLGDKSDLSEEIRELYEENGVAHLLAISGLHVSVAGGWIFSVLRKKGIGYGPACAAGGLLLGGYGTIVGFGSSVTRAAAMYLLFLLARYYGADYDIPSSLAFAGSALLLASPLKIRESGTILSFVSVFAIGMICPWVQEKLEERRQLSKKGGEIRIRDREILLRNRLGLRLKNGRPALTDRLRDNLTFSMVISMTTMPLLLHFFYGWSPYSILLNLLVLPSMTPLMLSALAGGLAGSLISCWSRFLGIRTGFIICLPAEMILRCFSHLFELVRNLPCSYLLSGCLPWGQVLLLYGVEAGIAWLWYRRCWRRLAVFSMAVFLAYGPARMKPLSMTLLSVGQGECIVLRLPDGISMMIDGGSTSRKEIGKYIIRPALKYYGISRLDYLVVTHMDDDHISGIRELLEREFPVRFLLVPWMGEAERKDSHFRDMVELAASKGVKVYRIKRGNRMHCGRVNLYCLNPFRGLASDDRNAFSVVLYLEYGDFDALLTGDLEEIQEEQLVRWLENYEKRTGHKALPGLQDGLSLLKVAHHGSSHSSSERFLKVFRPGKAVLSAGKNNRYGHPHMETLERLSKAGLTSSDIFGTLWGGAIELEAEEDGSLAAGYWGD